MDCAAKTYEFFCYARGVKPNKTILAQLRGQALSSTQSATPSFFPFAISSIDASSTYLGLEGVKALLDFVALHHTIRSLSIPNSGIDGPSVSVLLCGIPQNNSKINGIANTLHPSGAMTRGLGHQQLGLLHVDLSGNTLTTPCARSIWSALGGGSAVSSSASSALVTCGASMGGGFGVSGANASSLPVGAGAAAAAGGGLFGAVVLRTQDQKNTKKPVAKKPTSTTQTQIGNASELVLFSSSSNNINSAMTTTSSAAANITQHITTTVTTISALVPTALTIDLKLDRTGVDDPKNPWNSRILSCLAKNANFHVSGFFRSPTPRLISCFSTVYIGILATDLMRGQQVCESLIPLLNASLNQRRVSVEPILIVVRDPRDVISNKNTQQQGNNNSDSSTTTAAKTGDGRGDTEGSHHHHHGSSSSAAPFFYADTEEEIEEKIRLCRDPSNNNLPWLVVILEDETYPLIISKTQYNALFGVGAVATATGKEKKNKRQVCDVEGDSGDGESFTVNTKLAARSSRNKQRRLISHGVGGLIRGLQQLETGSDNNKNNNSDLEGIDEMELTADGNGNEQESFFEARQKRRGGSTSDLDEDDFDSRSNSKNISDNDETDSGSSNSFSDDEGDREVPVRVGGSGQQKRTTHAKRHATHRNSSATPVLSPLIYIIVKYGIHYSGRRALEPLVDRLGRRRAPTQRSPTSIVLFVKDERPETVDEVTLSSHEGRGRHEVSEGWVSTRPSPPPQQDAAGSSTAVAVTVAAMATTPVGRGRERRETQPRSLIASGKVSSAANIFALRHRIQQPQQNQEGKKEENEKVQDNEEKKIGGSRVRPHTTPSIAFTSAATVTFTPKAPNNPSAAAAAAASLQQLHRTDEDLQRARTYWEFVILLQRLPSPGFVETSTSTAETDVKSCDNEKKFVDDHDRESNGDDDDGALIETPAMRLVRSALTPGPLSLLSHTLLQTLRSLGAEDWKKTKRRESQRREYDDNHRTPLSCCSHNRAGVEVEVSPKEEASSPQKKSPHQVSNLALVLLPPLYDSDIFSRFNRDGTVEKRDEKSVCGSFQPIPSSSSSSFIQEGPTSPLPSPPPLPAVLSLAVLSYLYNSLTTVYGDDEVNTAVEAPKITASSSLETVGTSSSSPPDALVSKRNGSIINIGHLAAAAAIPNTACAILKILMNSTSPSLIPSYLSNHNYGRMMFKGLDATTREDEEIERRRRRSRAPTNTCIFGLFPALLTLAGVGVNTHVHAHNAFARSNPYYLQNEGAWMTLFAMSGILVEKRRNGSQQHTYFTDNESTQMADEEGILSRLEKAISHVLTYSSLAEEEHGDGETSHQKERSYFLSTSVTFLQELSSNIIRNEHIADPNVREVIYYCVPKSASTTAIGTTTSPSFVEDAQRFSFPLILYGGKSTGKQKSIAEALTRIALSSVANAALEFVEERNIKDNNGNKGNNSSVTGAPTPPSASRTTTPAPPIIIPYFAENTSLVSFLFFVINALNTVEKSGSDSGDNSNADANKGRESIPPLSQPEELAAYVHHRLQNSRIVNGDASCSSATTPKICFVIINAHKLETPYRHTARGGNGKDALSAPFTEPPHADDVRRNQNNLTKLQSSRLGGGGGGGGKGGVVSAMTNHNQNQPHGRGGGDGSSSESLLLRWLPAALPSHIRVIMTIDTASPLLSALRARVPQPYEKLCVSPFDKHFTLNQINKYSSSSCFSSNRFSSLSKDTNGWIPSSLWITPGEDDNSIITYNTNYQYGSSFPSSPHQSGNSYNSYHVVNAREQVNRKPDDRRGDSDNMNMNDEDDLSSPPAPPPRRLTSKATEDSVDNEKRSVTTTTTATVAPFSLASPITDPSSSRAHQHQDRFNMLSGDVLERRGPFDPDHRNGIDDCVYELPTEETNQQQGGGEHRRENVAGHQLPLSSEPSPVAEALLAKEESDTFWYPPLVVSFMKTSKVFNGQYRYPKCLWSNNAAALIPAAIAKKWQRSEQGEDKEEIRWTAETRPSTARTSRPTADDRSGEEREENSTAADADNDNASVMRNRLASDRDEIDDFLEQCELFELEKGGQESPRRTNGKCGMKINAMEMKIASEKVRLFVPDSCALLVRGILAHEEERLGIRTSQLEALEEKERERREDAERRKEEKLRKRLLRRQQQQQQLAAGGTTNAQNEMNKQNLIDVAGETSAMDNRSDVNKKISNERRSRRAKARRPLAANADRFSKLDPSSALSFSSHRGEQGGFSFSFGDDGGRNPFFSSAEGTFSPESDENNKNPSNNSFFTLSEAALMRDVLLMLVLGGPLTLPELVKVISEAYNKDALRLHRSYAAACDETYQQQEQQHQRQQQQQHHQDGTKEKNEEAEQMEKEKVFSKKFTSELRVLVVSVLIRLEKLHLITLPSSQSSTTPLYSCARIEKGSAGGAGFRVGCQLATVTSSHTITINGAAARDGILKFYGEQRGLGGGGNSAAAMMMMLSAGGSEDGSGGSRRVTNRSRISEWSASRSMSRPSATAGSHWHHPSTFSAMNVSVSLREDNMVPNHHSLSLLHAAASKYNSNNNNNTMGMSFVDSEYAATTATNLTDNENNKNPTPSTAATTMLTTHDNPEEELALRRMLASGVDFSSYQVALALFFKNELHRHLENVAEMATSSSPSSSSCPSSSGWTREGDLPTPRSAPLSTSEFIRVTSRIVPRCLSLHLALGQQERIVLDWLTSPRFIDLLLMLSYRLRDPRQQEANIGRGGGRKEQSLSLLPVDVSSSSSSSSCSSRVVCVPTATATLLYPMVLDTLFQISAMAADLEEAFSSVGGYESIEEEDEEEAEVNGEIELIENESPVAAAYVASSTSFRQDLKEIEDSVAGPSPSSTIRSHRRTLLRRRIVSEFTTLLPFSFHGWSLAGIHVGGLFTFTTHSLPNANSSTPLLAKDTVTAKAMGGSSALLLLPSVTAAAAASSPPPPPRPPISVMFQQEALLSLSPFDSIYYRRAVRHMYETAGGPMMTSMTKHAKEDIKDTKKKKKKDGRGPFFIPLNSGLGETVSKMTVTLPRPRPQNKNAHIDGTCDGGAAYDTFGGIESNPSLLPNKAILHCFSSSEIPTATIPDARASVLQQESRKYRENNWEGVGISRSPSRNGFFSPLQLRCLVVCTTRDEVYVLDSNTGLVVAYLSSNDCLVDDEFDDGRQQHQEQLWQHAGCVEKKKKSTCVEFVGTILVPSSSSLEASQQSPSQVSSRESEQCSCSSPMLAVVIAKERVVVWDFLKSVEKKFLRHRRQQRSQEDNFDEKENDDNSEDRFGVTTAAAREQPRPRRNPQAQAASHDDDNNKNTLHVRCVVRGVTASVTRKIFCSVMPSEAAFYIDNTNFSNNKVTTAAPLNNNIGVNIHQQVAAAGSNSNSGSSSSSSSTSLVVLRDIHLHTIKFLDVDRGVVVKTFMPDPALVQIGNEASPEEEKQHQAHTSSSSSPSRKETHAAQIKQTTTSATTAAEREVSPHPPHPPPPPRRKEEEVAKNKAVVTGQHKEASSVRFAPTSKEELLGQEFTQPLHHQPNNTAHLPSFSSSSPYFSRVLTGGAEEYSNDDNDEDEDSNHPPPIIIREASFTKDGDLVLVSNYDVVIYSAGAGLPISSQNAEENLSPNVNVSSNTAPLPPTVLRHLGLIHAFAISEDGLLVATVVGCETFLWISKTGALLHVCRVPSPRDEAIYVDNAHTNQNNAASKLRVGQRGGVPDDEEGANNNDHSHLPPDRTHEPIAVFQSICFHPNGNTLLASTSTGTVAVFSTFSGKLTKILYVLPRSAIVDSLLHRKRYKRNANQKASASESGVSLLEGLVQHSTQFACTSIAFTPDHLRVVAAAGPLLVQWDATTFEAVGAVVAHGNSSITDISVSVKRVVKVTTVSSSGSSSARTSRSPYENEDDDDNNNNKVPSTPLVQDHLLTVSASGEAKVWNFSDQLTTAREALRGVVSSQKGGLHRGGTVADDVLVKINMASETTSTNPTKSVSSTLATTNGSETRSSTSDGRVAIVPLKTKLIQLAMISSITSFGGIEAGKKTTIPMQMNQSQEGRGGGGKGHYSDDGDDIRDKILLCLTQPTYSGEEIPIPVESSSSTPHPRPHVHNGHPAAAAVAHDTFSSNPVITIPSRLVANGGGGGDDGKKFGMRGGGTFNTLTAWRWYCCGDDDDDHAKKDTLQEKEKIKIPSSVQAIRDDMLLGNGDRGKLTQTDGNPADLESGNYGTSGDAHHSRPADSLPSPSSTTAAAAEEEEEDLLDFDPKAFEQMLRKQRLNSERKYFQELNKDNKKIPSDGEERKGISAIGGGGGKETQVEVKQSLLKQSSSRRPTPPPTAKPGVSSPTPSPLSSAASAKGGEQKEQNFEEGNAKKVSSLISPPISLPLDTFFTRRDKERGKVWSISGISTFITVSISEESSRSSSFVIIVAIALNTHLVVLCASTGRQIAAIALPAMTVDPAGLKWELLNARNNFILLTSSSASSSSSRINGQERVLSNNSLKSTAIHLFKLDTKALSRRLRSSLASQPPHLKSTDAARVFSPSAALSRTHFVPHAGEKPQEERIPSEIIKFISSSLSSHRGGRVLDARTVKSCTPILPRGSVVTTPTAATADRQNQEEEKEEENDENLSLLSLITVATDGMVRVWSVANLAERASLKMHPAAVETGDDDNQLSNYVLGKHANSRITAASISLLSSSSPVSSSSTYPSFSRSCASFSSEPAIRDGEYGVNITLFFEKSGAINDNNQKICKTVEGGCVSSMRVACCPRPLHVALSKQTNAIRRGSVGINVSPHCPAPPRSSSSARPTTTSSSACSSSLEAESISLFESLSLPNSNSPFWKILETRFTTSVSSTRQGSGDNNNNNTKESILRENKSHSTTVLGNEGGLSPSSFSGSSAATATLTTARRTLVVPVLGDLLLRAREGTTNLTLFDVQSLSKVQSVGIFRRFFTLNGTYPSIGGDDDDETSICEEKMRTGGGGGGGVAGDLERLRAVSCISFLPNFGASSVPTPSSGRAGWVVCGCTTGEVLVYELFL